MSLFPVIFPYSFGWDGPNALPLTFPFTFGIQFGDTSLTVTATPVADVHFAAANGIASLAIAPASSASASRTAWGDTPLSVNAARPAAMYWTMNVQTATPVTAGIPASAAVDAFSGGSTAVTVGFPADMTLSAEADTSLTAQAAVGSPLAQELGLLDNGVTATVGFTADLTLAASGNAILDSEARFLANEQELGLLNTTDEWVALIGAEMTLLALADTDTPVSASFGADAPLSGVMDADMPVDAAVSAAVQAAFSADAPLSVENRNMAFARRTQYIAAALNAVATVVGEVVADWNANAPRTVTASADSDFSAAFYSWSECYTFVVPSATGRRIQYADLNEPAPISFPLQLPFVFGGMIMPGQIAANTYAAATLIRQLDAMLEAESATTADQQLHGVTDASVSALVHFDKEIKLDAYAYADLPVEAAISAVINAHLYGYAPLAGFVFIDGAEDELAIGNTSVAVVVALSAAAKLDGSMLTDQTVGVGFGNPVLSYPISAPPVAVTAAARAVGGVNHPAGANLVIVPVTPPGEMSANFAAKTHTATVANTAEAFSVGYRIAASLGITDHATVEAIVGVIRASLEVSANGTADATLQPIVITSVTGWWHFPE